MITIYGVNQYWEFENNDADVNQLTVMGRGCPIALAPLGDLAACETTTIGYGHIAEFGWLWLYQHEHEGEEDQWYCVLPIGHAFMEGQINWNPADFPGELLDVLCPAIAP